MSDKNKTKAELTAEISELKKRLSVLEKNGGERRRYDQRTRKSEDRYVMLVEKSYDAIYLIYDKKFEYVNQRFEELFGYNKEELYLPDFDVMKLFMPHDRMQAGKVLEKLYQIEPIRPQYEFTGITKDSRQIEIELSVAFVPYKAGMAIQGIARDITARKQMDAALRESEKKFREFAELLPGSAFECDLNFQITFINRNALKTFGYTKEDIAAGFNILKVIAPADFDYVLKQYTNLINDTIHDPIEINCLRKDGSKLLVQLSAAPIIDDGKPVGLRGLAIDITEHKNRKTALRQSEERYRSIIETIEDGYYEFDLSGNFTFFNEACRKLMGFPSEEIIGMNFRQYTDKETAEKMNIIAKKVYKTGEPEKGSDFEIITKDGSRKYIEISVSLIRDADGKPAGFRGIARDETERRQMENELRESRERFKNMVVNVPGIIYQYLIHQDGSVSIPYLSEVVRQLGVEPQEIINDPSKIYDFVDEERKESIFAAIAESMSSLSRLFWEGEADINNETKWLRIVSQPRLQSNGDILYDGIILDMTESRRIEEEKKELEMRLQQAQKMEAVGTLAGGIAHDFNNLLMGIQGHTSLMLLDTVPSHSHFRKLKSIEELVMSGANLTKQLLGFARRGRYEIKPTNINDLIDKTTTLFGRTKKEILIHRLLENDIWVVEVDQGQIEQAFLNLYVNAWQAMPSGGDIYLETKNVIVAENQIKQYSMPAGNYVKISITDTGVGMDDATRERIFEPFFTTKEMGRGTGLGLATVYGIIKGHNGMIDVYSEKGHGTSFSIYLPASDKKIVAQRKPDMLLLKGQETVLLIDDEVAIIDVTRELLEELGYKVIGVSSGADAIEIYRVKNKEIDLVILDMIMPWMSGSETFDALKLINPQVKVILSSGYSIDGEAAEIMNKGCLTFIQKPFNIVDISRKIRETLNKTNIAGRENGK
jgi:two-component system, cell cycle sensor histidine kinase and response regulator CckA